MSNDERHYNINKLNIIFAISSVILLGSVAWMLMDDYDREWKKHQAQFRTLDLEKTRIKHDAATRDLKNNSEYQAIVTKLEEAKKSYESNCSSFEEIEDEIAKLKANDDIVGQRYKFAKAELDAARYNLEAAKEHKSRKVRKAQKAFDDLVKRVGELKLEVEASQLKISEKRAIIDQCGESLNDIAKQERQLAQERILLQRKLTKADPAQMSFVNQIAQRVRDLPILDLADPKNKIEQIVLKDIRDDVHFLDVPKVDRCVTCHLGITNPEYKDADQPYRTHPNLGQYVGKNSNHPIEEFGCTSCHGGRGRGTDFNGAAHTPNSEEQKKEWQEKYGWKHFELWEEPMLPSRYTEAGCFKCHDRQDTIKGADQLNLGLNLVEKAGCYSCHNIDKYKDWPKIGPDLDKLASKVSDKWAYNWIKGPLSFRHAWMPTFFNQSNTDDPQSRMRAEQEIHAIVQFLFERSQEYEMAEIPVEGNVEKGKELISAVGCLACHQMKEEKIDVPISRDVLRRQHGPNLSGLGSKTTKKWLYNWLKEPSKYHDKTRMPSFRLTDQEAADIAEYLIQDKNDAFEQIPVPKANEDVINVIVHEFLMRNNTTKQADEKLAQMNLNEKLVFAGSNLIGPRGCYSCHNISGYEDRKPIGTDLTEEGSKSIHKLDFGLIHDIEHTNYAWFEQKLKDPRRFDHGKVKKYSEKLTMPNFYFTEEEITAITTALMGFVHSKTVENKKRPRTYKNLVIEEGQKIVKQYNCQGCHLIEGEGASITGPIEDWLVKYEGKDENEAKAVVSSFSPPNLIGEGQKVRSDWFVEFLHAPSEIRPWLKVRMPTYNFDAKQINSLVRYFNALDDEEFPYIEQVDVSMTDDEYKQAEKLFSEDYFSCAQCHIVGDKMPSGSPERWAPNFALTKSRLKPRWIIEWLKNPAKLLPGTKMPTFYDPEYFDISGPDDIFDGDENKQLEMLRNYLMTLSEDAHSSMLHPPSSTQPVE